MAEAVVPVGKVWQFHSAGKLVFGPGAIAQSGSLTASLGCRRPLIVTDATLVELGLTEPLLASLKSAGLESIVFDGGAPEPEVAVAERAVDLGRATHPDAVIGFGGGSNMDVAKYVATTLTYGGRPADYFGVDRVPGRIMPLIEIPTTSGTGSEVSHAAVLTDTAAGVKVSSLSNHLRPLIAIVDPELTYGCPAKIMAHSGIDALTHAIEGCTATDHDKLETIGGRIPAYFGRFPIGEAMGEKAIRLIGRNLVTAVNHQQDHAARDAMSLAATFAGLAFSNCGVALVHALEYPIGATVHCSHGEGNGCLLPYVLRFILPARREELAEIARWLGCCEGVDATATAERGIERIVEIRREIGIASRLRDLGLSREKLRECAEKTWQIQRLMWLTPRRPTFDDLVQILNEAY